MTERGGDRRDHPGVRAGTVADEQGALRRVGARPALRRLRVRFRAGGADPSPTLTANGLARGRDVWRRPAPTIVTSRRSKDGIVVGRQLPPGGGENVGGHDWQDGPPSHMAKKEDRPARKAQGAGNQPRGVDEPAATLDTRTDLAEWVSERPSTAVCGDPRISPPGWRGNPEDYADGNPTRSGDNAVRVKLWEALVLQGFDRDYPVQGSRSQQFTQVGNAFPPPVARAILSAFIHNRERDVA